MDFKPLENNPNLVRFKTCFKPLFKISAVNFEYILLIVFFFRILMGVVMYIYVPSFYIYVLKIIYLTLYLSQ